MPNRILKESITTSDEIAQCSWFEEVLFYRLMVKCDDFGRYDGRVKIIKGQCFPLKDITTKDIEKALNKLSAVGLVRRYEVGGHPYLQLVTWEKHQQIRSKRSKFPSPDDVNASDINCNQMIANVPVIQSNPNPNTNTNLESESNVIGTQGADIRSRFQKPSFEEVESYINENYYLVTPQEFYDYYESNGWKVGRNSMKDWKATIRNWNAKAQKQSTDKKKGGLVF